MKWKRGWLGSFEQGTGESEEWVETRPHIELEVMRISIIHGQRGVTATQQDTVPRQAGSSAAHRALSREGKSANCEV